MKTKEFITQYLTSPVVAHRKKATNMAFNEARSNSEFRKQLIENFGSSDYDIVLNSLKVFRALAEYDPQKASECGSKITLLSKRTDHFSIAWLCKEIADVLYEGNLLSETAYKTIQGKVTPTLKHVEEEEYFHSRCDYSLEYRLGNQDLKYELDHICTAFRYECNKAQRKVFSYMRSLGHKREKVYRETKPARWRDDHYGFRYETDLIYFSKHSIQVFLMWCVENLEISQGAWNELVRYEREWDPSIPDPFLISGKPDIIGNFDLKEDVDKWLKTRTSKKDVYKLLDLSSEWVPLYENTYLKHDEKAFSRHVYTCCIKQPLGKFSKKSSSKD